MTHERILCYNELMIIIIVAKVATNSTITICHHFNYITNALYMSNLFFEYLFSKIAQKACIMFLCRVIINYTINYNRKLQNETDDD